jgi:hypothetical protein
LGDGEKLLCVHCFNLIAELTDGSSSAKKHGGAIMLKEIKADAPEGSKARKRWDERQNIGPRKRAAALTLKLDLKFPRVLVRTPFGMSCLGLRTCYNWFAEQGDYELG